MSDAADEVQSAARDRLGEMAILALDTYSEVRKEQVSGPVDLPFRAGLFYLAESLQLLCDAHHLLAPGEQTVAYARPVSPVLRSLVDVYARQLAVRTAQDPEAEFLSQLASSLKQDLRALGDAETAGADVEIPRRLLEEALAKTGASPREVRVADVLRDAGEHEFSCVHAWESGALHIGASAIMERSRTVTAPIGSAVDVNLWPTTPWRVGQLTWASYGVGLRLISFLAKSLDLDLGPLVRADKKAREIVQTTARRKPEESEPPSPNYAAFKFPLHR